MSLKRKLLIIPLLLLAFAHATAEEFRLVTVVSEPIYSPNLTYGGSITGIVRGYANPPEFYVSNLHAEEIHSDKLKLPKGSVCRVVSDRSTAKILLTDEMSEYIDVLVSIESPPQTPPCMF